MSNVYQKRKDMSHQIDDDEDSNPFLDKVVEESKTYEESSSKLARSDFAASDDEELQENTLEETEGENESENFNLLKKNPLISEGNPVSPIDEECLMEDDPEDAFEANSTLDQNFVKAYGFLSIDTSLYSSEPVSIVSQFGNPLGGLPFENLVRDSSNDSNQRKDKTVEFAIEYKRHITSSDDVMSEAVPDSRLNKQNICETTSKGDHLNRSSLRKINEHQKPSEGVSFAFQGSSDTGSTIADLSEQSRTKHKKSPLKHSTKETFPCGEYEKISPCYAEHSFAKATGGPSIVLSSGSQTGPSRPDPSGHSRAESEKSPEMTFLCDQCGEILYSMRNYENHILLHEIQNAPEETSISLTGGRQISSSEPNSREGSRIKTKKSLLTPKELFPSGKSGKIPSSKMNYRNRMLSQEHQKPSKGASIASSGGSKLDESRENPSGHSRFTALKHSPKKTFTCRKCGKVFYSWRSYENHVHEHDKPSEGTSVSLHSGSSARKTRPDDSYSGTTPKKASKARPDHSYSGTTPKKASKTRPDHSYLGTAPKKSPKKTFLCDQCGKMLSCGESYKIHMKLHTNEKPFLCPECGKAFALETYLQNHFRTHTGERPFVCNVCGRSFVHSSNCSTHRRRHTK